MINVKINRILKKNLPKKTDVFEIYFTENNGLYVSDNNGNVKEVLDLSYTVEDVNYVIDSLNK